MTVTASAIRDLLHYDPAIGVFSWRCGYLAGTKAGRQNRDGYILIRVMGETHLAHRLAWLYVTGEWPEADIDHRDRVPGNNRFNNLRAATRSQNLGNRSLNRNNTSGYKGVYRAVGCDRWIAAIRCRGQKHHIGFFKDREEAARAYMAAAEKLFGEFASDGRSA